MYKLQELLKWLDTAQWLNLIFLVLTLVSIYLSFYFYFKSKRKKEPVYLTKTFNLVKDNLAKVKKLKIYYDSQETRTLSVTKIALWNRGNEAIDKSDVAVKDPLRVQINSQFEILDAFIIFSKNPANNFSLNALAEKKSIQVKFDYFNENEGVVLEIFHTGYSGDNLKVIGSFKNSLPISSAEIEIDVLFQNVMTKLFSPWLFKLNKGRRILVFILCFPILLPLTAIITVLEVPYYFLKIPRLPSDFSLRD